MSRMIAATLAGHPPLGLGVALALALAVAGLGLWSPRPDPPARARTCVRAGVWPGRPSARRVGVIVLLVLLLSAGNPRLALVLAALTAALGLLWLLGLLTVAALARVAPRHGLPRPGRRALVALLGGIAIAASGLALTHHRLPRPVPPPVLAAGNASITAIRGYGDASMLLESDGSVWTWGYNQYGELGDGTTVDRTTPGPVPGLTNIIAIAGGEDTGYALENNGTVWTWGDASVGEDGSGSVQGPPCYCHTTPVPVPGLTNVTAIAAGGYFALALKSDGTVWGWGDDTYGQMGQGAPTSNNCNCELTPTQVPGLSNVTAISAGDEHSVALTSVGTVWAWGGNWNGQVGNGTVTTTGCGCIATPTQAVGLSGITAIAGAESYGFHTLALKSDGTVWAWGANDAGELGNGTTATSGCYCDPTPGQVLNLTAATGIAAGMSWSLAVTSDGKAWGWGDNSLGELGLGTTVGPVTTPTQVTVVSNVTAVDTGYSFALALEQDGSLWSWGENDEGQLGNGSRDSADGAHPTPQRVLPATSELANYDILHYCAACAAHAAAAAAGKPVNAIGGNEWLQQSDFSLPGRGLPIDLVRTYNSADPTDRGFGYGWSTPYTMSLAQETPTTVLVRYPDGRRDLFTQQADGSYTAPTGIYNTLAPQSGGGYTLTTPQQVTYTFDASGRLLSLADRNGNTTTLTYATSGITITDPSGRSIVLAYGTGADASHIISLTESGPLGRTVSYAYDAAGDLTSVTDVRGGVTTMTYDADHHLLAVTDPLGHTQETNTYDALGRVTQQQDALQHPLSLSYDVGAQCTTLTDARSNTTTYCYTTGYQLTSVTDPLNHTTSYSYDSQNNLTQVTDPLGKSTSYTYDSHGNVLTVTDPLTHTTTYAYNSFNEPLTVTDALNRVTTYAYDAVGNRTSVTDPLNHTTTYGYDSVGDLTSVTDANTHTTTYGYDAAGDQTSLTDPLNHTTTQTFDSGSRRLTVTDANTHTTTYAYNAANQVTSVTDPLNHTTSYVYDAAGNLSSVTDANTHTTTYGYDAANERTSVTDANNHTTTYGYDANGNQTGVTDATSRTTTYAYDAANRLTSVTDNGQHTTTYTLDADGQVTAVTDANSHTTTYAIDAAHRLTTVTDPLNATTTYAYDAANQLVTVTDANSHATSYSYDLDGRPTGKTDALNHTWSVSYDPAGNLASTTDANTHTTTYTYDAADRLTTIAYYDGTSVGYTYDNANQRLTMVDATGTTSYAYDAAGELTSVTAPGTGTVGYTYSPVGLEATLTYPNGYVVSYGYDPANRLTSITDWLTQVTTYGYDAAGRLTSIAYPTNVSANYSYDTAGRLATVSGATGSGPFSMAYTRDAVGNPTQVVETGVPASGTTTYGYDAANQLTSATYPDASTASWGYDPVGNRTSATLNGTTTPATYNAVNQLLTSGSTSYSYDANGNLLSDGTSTYTWDARNLLVGVSNATLAASYTYDGNGYRVGKTVNGVTTAYTWDRTGLGGLGTVIADSSGKNVFGPAGLQERYQPLVQLQQLSMFYAVGDGLGSVRLVTDASGTVLGGATYDPWGAPASYTGSTTLGGFGFTGEQVDPETGFVYLRARYYDPATGRFLNPDPLGYNGSGVNLFAYVGNNPATLTDPSGLDQPGDASEAVLLAAMAGEFQPAPLEDLEAGLPKEGEGVNAPVVSPPSEAASGEAAAAPPNCPFANPTGPQPSGPEGEGRLAPAVRGGSLEADAISAGVPEAVLREVSAKDPTNPEGAIQSKDEARLAARRLTVSDAQYGSVSRGIMAGSGNYDVFKDGNGDVVVVAYRPGTDGFQAWVKIVNIDGVSTNVQLAYDATGELVHVDVRPR